MLSRLSSLQELNLCLNQLFEIKADAFNGLINLKKLDLSYNRLAEIDEIACNYLSNLHELDLRCNPGFKLSKIFSIIKHIKKIVNKEVITRINMQ